MARRKSRKVSVGLVKILAEWAKPERNLRLLEDVTKGLASAKLDVLVTPECFLDGYMIHEQKKWTRANASCASKALRSS